MLKPQPKLHQNLMVICAVALLLSCTKAPEIELRGPEKPQPPVADTTTPSSNEEGGPGTPSPTPIPVTRYRALCDDRYTFLKAVSSEASSSGFGADLDLQVWPENQPLPTRGAFAPEDRNLADHLFPQVIKLLSGSVIRFAYSAKPMNQDPSLSPTGVLKRNIYISEMSMIDRVGRAVFMAEEMPLDYEAGWYSAEENFQGKTFSVSDRGRFLMVIGLKGVLFFDTVSRQALGHVKLKSADKYFAPSFRESDSLLTVSRMKSGRVVTELLNIEFKSSGEVSNSKAVTSVSGLRRPLISVGPGGGELFAGLRFTAEQETEAVIVDLKSTTRAITALPIGNLPLKGRVASSLAVWKDASLGELRAAIGFENTVVVGSGYRAKLKVDQAFVRVLKLDPTIGSATAIGRDYPFPFEAVQAIESASVSSRWPSMKEFVVTPDGKAVFALLPGSLSFNLYRFASNGFDRVSLEECTNLSIGVEP